jgi:hypothetical protein
MNEEYLWDKSGEPDPEIQQLEEILGTLRYQPQELKIPMDLQVKRRRSYLPLVAIAATVAVALLAGGIWLRVQSQKATAPSEQAQKSSTLPERRNVPTPELAGDKRVAPKSELKSVSAPLGARKASQNLIAVRHASNARDAALEAKERELALATKDQLMMAFRLASEKLNVAQRRAQTPAPANLNRNQHKVG